LCLLRELCPTAIKLQQHLASSLRLTQCNSAESLTTPRLTHCARC
jgi:hypothetical protein